MTNPKPNVPKIDEVSLKEFLRSKYYSIDNTKRLIAVIKRVVRENITENDLWMGDKKRSREVTGTLRLGVRLWREFNLEHCGLNDCPIEKDCPIDDKLVDIEAIKSFLRKKGYKESTVRVYSDYMRRLMTRPSTWRYVRKSPGKYSQETKQIIKRAKRLLKEYQLE